MDSLLRLATQDTAIFPEVRVLGEKLLSMEINGWLSETDVMEKGRIVSQVDGSWDPVGK
jgi:hypothetical protein